MPGAINFAFIGPRGAGKSRLSRKFARKIDRLLLSTDVLVSYEAGGRSITELVADEGWPQFREREYALLNRICHMPGVVIDCGGGIIVDLESGADGQYTEVFSERKATLLKEHCTTVYIRRDPRWLLSRELESSHRPALSRDYESLLARRLPWYERVADYILDLSDRDSADGVDELRRRFGV